MASARNVYVFVRNSLFRVNTVSLTRRTFSQVTYKQFRSVLGCGSVTKLVGVYKYSPSSTRGLADEHLAAKIQPDPKEKSKGTDEGDKESEKDKAKKETGKIQKWMKIQFWVFGVMVAGLTGMTIWVFGPPKVGDDGQPVPDEYSGRPVLAQYFLRTFKGIDDKFTEIKEPSRSKLLPDPVQPPYIQPPYTLVLEMRDILVHPEWTYETGWRFKKRPGIEFLLHHCAPPLFEIIIYTTEQGHVAFPIIDQLDPNGYIWYRLFRDATRYEGGKHIKDLTCLNRDLERVICVDWDSDAVSTPRNHLKVKRWDGDMSDKSLLDLGFMLRTIAESEVGDVREVIDYYRTFDDPLAAFRENERLAQEQELAIKQKVDERQHQQFTSSVISSFFRRN